MKSNIIIALISVFLFSSCGVFLGPISELSLEQRMAKGWRLVYEFQEGNNSAGFYNTKVLFGRSTNELRCYYFSWSMSQFLSYFTTNSFSNTIVTAISTSMPNKFDITYNRTNDQLIYYDSTTLTYWDNGSMLGWNPIPFTTMANMLISDDKTVIGADVTTPASLLTSTWGNNSPTAKLLPNSYLSNISKCRNKYNNNHVIYAVYWNYASFKYEMQMLTLEDPNNFMLDSPYETSVSSYLLPIVESDGGNRLYMLVDNKICRYESSSKSFVTEYTLPFTFMNNPMNSISATEFLGDNLLVAFYNSYNPTNPVILMSYNTSAKTYTETAVIPGTTTETVIGMDMYYDTKSYALYIAVLYYNSGFIHGKLYMNQF